MTPSSSGPALVGFGLASSLGRGSQACAAARAGLARAREITDYEAFDTLSGEMAPVTGHACTELQGFAGTGRLLGLIELATQDLFASWTPPQTRPRTALLLVLPDHAAQREAMVVESEHLQETRAAVLDMRAARIEAREEREHRRVKEALASRLEREGITPSPITVMHGPAGFGDAMLAAGQLLLAGSHDLCILASADSLLDAESLEALAICDRLKTPENPAALQPGEGAALLVLASPSGAQRAAFPILAHLDSVAIETSEPNGGPASLTAVLRSAAGEGVTEEPALVLSDLNGETERAALWGHALASCPLPAGATAYYPALFFGEVGAARGAIATCFLLHLWARDRSLPSWAVLVVSDYRGRSAALRLLRNPPLR